MTTEREYFNGYIHLDRCPRHGSKPVRCLAGCSAHPSNWYCEKCDEEKRKEKDEWKDWIPVT